MKARVLLITLSAAVALALAGGPAHPQGRAVGPKPAPAPRTTEAKPRAGTTERKPGQRSSSPIVIDADRMEAVKKEGLVIFTGNVVAKQDNSVQTADRMEVYLDDRNERVVRIISTGNVKIVTEDCRTGTARRAEYYEDDQRLLLIGNAKVWQDDNVVTGEEIEIWLGEDRSIVKGGATERVKSIFYPRREEAREEATPAARQEGKGPASCG